MQRSKLVLGFVVALGVGGLGAAAVAMENDTGGAGSIASEPTTTVVVDPTTTVPTTVAPTTTLAPTPGAVEPSEGADGSDPGVERSTDGCDGVTYANHGEYVSGVAHDPDRQPGDLPAAAHSDCGKPITSVGDTDAAEQETPESSVPDTSDDATPETPGQGQGQGKGLGKGQS
jgi:hypothetical protein